MNQKLFFGRLFALVLGCLFIAATLLSSGAPAGRTGAPGDLTCADGGCHFSNPVNTGDGAVVIEAPINYTPGTPVELVVRTSRPGAARFGFQITARGPGGAMAGSWRVTEGTQLADFGQSPAYLTHAAPAPFATDTYEWTVTWNPPAEPVGEVTFYAATNTANGDGSNFDDFIYTTSQSTAYSGNTAVETAVYPQKLTLSSVYPNPAQDQFTAQVELSTPSAIRIDLYDNIGRIRSSILTEMRSAGLQDVRMDLPTLASGTYSFKVEAAGQSQMGIISIVR